MSEEPYNLEPQTIPSVDRAVLSEKHAMLQAMKMAELQDTYFELFKRATLSRNRNWLIRRIYYRMQELQEGVELSRKAKAKVVELAARRTLKAPKMGETPKARVEPEPPERDPRLPPPGTMLTRRHRGVDYRIEVLEEGFRFKGEYYPTLSKIARKVTGTSWNGFIWAGLAKRKRKG